MTSSGMVDAVRVKELARSARGVLAAVGLASTALSGYLALAVSHALVSPVAWSDTLPLALLGAVLLATGVQALYIAVTGRLRGRLNRLLIAVRDSFGEIQTP